MFKKRTVILKSIVFLCVLALLFSANIMLYCPKVDAALSNVINLTASTGWKIFEPIPSTSETCHYGPSIIINADNSIDMWTQGVPSTLSVNDAWDAIWYFRSTDGGHNWTRQRVMDPTPNSDDCYSCCDPGVIKIGSYYYIGYTSTMHVKGTVNNVYLARSTSPSGPFSKWNGTGWGGNPKPVAVWPKTNTDDFGYGEPSFVMLNGTLYLYCTDSAGGSEKKDYLHLFTCSDTSSDNWPSTLADRGRVNLSKDYGEDSIDVKYVDSLNRFVAVTTGYRFSNNASVRVYQSEDGVNWELSLFKGTQVELGAHNLGISSNSSGHIDTAKSNFIAYGAQPEGYGWGNWPTFLNPISLSTMTYGTAAVFGGAISTVNWDWTVSRLWDGNISSGWSSTPSTTADTVKNAFIDLGAAYNLDGVKLSSVGQCFPVDFKIQVSDDRTTWWNVPGQSYTNYSNLAAGEYTFTFSSAIHARYIRVNATKLRTDWGSSYYLQLGEIKPVKSSDQSTYTSLITLKTPTDINNSLLGQKVMDMSNGTVLAQQFTTASTFNAVDIKSFIYSTNHIAYTIKLYQWNTNYATTVAGTPLEQSVVLIEGNNRNVQLSFDQQAAGTYLMTVTPSAADTSYTEGTPRYGIWVSGASTSGVAYNNGTSFAGSLVCRYYTTSAAADSSIYRALSRTAWNLTASSQYSSSEAPSYAKDASMSTRWRSSGLQSSGQWFRIDMDSAQIFDKIVLNCATEDYPRAFTVYVSNDATNWTSVTNINGCANDTNIIFKPQNARYIKLQLTAASTTNYWCINEINVFSVSAPADIRRNGVVARSAWIVTASSEASDTDIAGNAIDGASTRWSTGLSQATGQWLSVDMGNAQSFNRVSLSSTTGDYPRGYSIYASNDGTNWGSAIASGTGTTQNIDVSLSSVQTARYFKIQLTASAASWWSVTELNVQNTTQSNYSFKAMINNLFVCADDGGASPLIANRTSADAWERYTMLFNADGTVSLKSATNGLYVCADNIGASPLIANKTAIGVWESFEMIVDPYYWTISLKSKANNQYVSADNAGASPLIANKTAIGTWESFRVWYH